MDVETKKLLDRYQDAAYEYGHLTAVSERVRLVLRPRYMHLRNDARRKRDEIRRALEERLK